MLISIVVILPLYYSVGLVYRGVRGLYPSIHPESQESYQIMLFPEYNSYPNTKAR